MPARDLCATALLASLCGCVNLHFDREVGAEPITEATVDRLSAGSSDLARCVHELGAPVMAWEQPRGSFALAWSWRDEFDWGISVSFPIRTAVNASYRWSDTRLDQPAVLVLFDQKLVAQQIRRGTLREITKGLAKPSSSVEDE